jgi:DNA polymerase/3'-5' exonuclease PolX
MEYGKAFAISQEYKENFLNLSKRVEITGSIRRIERDIQIIDYIMLNSNEINTYLRVSKKAGSLKIIKNGYLQKIIKFSDIEIPMNIYLANGDNFGMVHLYTTGRRDFVKLIIKMLKKSDFYFACTDGKTKLYENLRYRNQEICPVKTEETIFDLLNMKFIKPESR